MLIGGVEVVFGVEGRGLISAGTGDDFRVEDLAAGCVGEEAGAGHAGEGASGVAGTRGDAVGVQATFCVADDGDRAGGLKTAYEILKGSEEEELVFDGGTADGEAELIDVVLGIDFGEIVGGVEVLVLDVVPCAAVDIVGSTACDDIHDGAGVAAVLGFVVVEDDTDFLERVWRRVVDAGVVEEIVPHEAVEEHEVLRVAGAGCGEGGALGVAGEGGGCVDVDDAGEKCGEGDGVVSVDGEIFDEFFINHGAESCRLCVDGGAAVVDDGDGLSLRTGDHLDEFLTSALASTRMLVMREISNCGDVMVRV